MPLHATLLNKWADIETYLLQLNPEAQIEQADTLVNMLEGLIRGAEDQVEAQS